MTKKLKFFATLMLLILTFGVFMTISNMQNGQRNVDAASLNVPVSGSYETADNKGYNPSKAEKYTMSFNSNSFGNLQINGAERENNYNGVVAYSANDYVSMTYTKKYGNSQINNTTWEISDDTATSVNDISLNSAKIRKGAIIIEKKNLKESNYTVLLKAANIFEQNSFNYTSVSGEDISIGCYYRITVAYEIHRTYTVQKKFLFIKWTETEDEYKNCLEIYNLFIGRNSCNIQILDLAEKDYSSYSDDETTIKTLKNGDTLSSGSVTTKGFQLNFLNNKSYKVTYKKNGGSSISVSDGQKITANGRYDITVKSLFGKTKTTTVYVFSGGTDKGYSTYFGQSIFNGKRIADLSQTLPTYQQGVSLNLNAVGNYIPQLSGTITNLTTKYVITVEPSSSKQTFTLDEAGVYYVSLTNGRENLAGTTLNYDFAFIVSNASTAPSFNIRQILSNFATEDFETKHIEVLYTMNSGKNAYICFDKDSYTLAYQFAYELEKKYINEIADEKYAYIGVVYDDNIALVEAINEKINEKLSYRYFTKAYSDFYISDDNLTLSINTDQLDFAKDIYLTTASEFSKMLNQDDIIDGNYKFIKIGDYESKSITATNLATGKITKLSYGKKLSTMLKQSGRYLITETNQYNESITYYISYSNKNQTEITLNINEQTILINNSNYQIINAQNVKISDITNALDSDGVIVVSDLINKTYTEYNYEDAKGLELNGSNYLISVIDRSGNVYNIIVNCLETKILNLTTAIDLVRNKNIKLFDYIKNNSDLTKSVVYNG